MLNYTGGGAYIIGVPARDLTDAEEAQYSALIKEQEKASGMRLYAKPHALPATAKHDKDAPKGDKE